MTYLIPVRYINRRSNLILGPNHAPGPDLIPGLNFILGPWVGPGTRDQGQWALDPGHWVRDPGHWEPGQYVRYCVCLYLPYGTAYVAKPTPAGCVASGRPQQRSWCQSELRNHENAKTNVLRKGETETYVYIQWHTKDICILYYDSCYMCASQIPY